MANHKDALKRIKQNAKRRTRGRHYRATMRGLVDKVRTAVDEGDAENARLHLREATRVLHRGVSKGLIHRNQAARRISRLNKAVKGLGA